MEEKTKEKGLSKMKVQIKKGDIIQGPLWPEPVEVKFVENTGNYSRLFIIKNPAKNLNPEAKIEMVRYFVEKDEIIKKGEKEV